MKQRIVMLGRNPATIRQRTLASALLVSTVLAAATTAWGSQPPRAIPTPATAQLHTPVVPIVDMLDSKGAQAPEENSTAFNPAPLNLTPAPLPAAVEPAPTPPEAAESTAAASVEPVAKPSAGTLADSREIGGASAAKPQDADDFEAARTERGVLRMFGQVPGRGKARADRAAGQQSERERQRAASN